MTTVNRILDKSFAFFKYSGYLISKEKCLYSYFKESFTDTFLNGIVSKIFMKNIIQPHRVDIYQGRHIFSSCEGYKQNKCIT